VFFTPSLGHTGMYIGGGSFIHAPRTGDVVKISSLSDSWYASQYQGAVRVA
jgi:cell wall-associated NlpC family hydrolase